MVTLRLQESGTVAVLTLPTHLAPRHADSLKTCLRHSLNQEGRLIVDCEKVASVDADCLVILCAALRLSKQLRKDIVLAGNQPDPFLDAARSVKFMHCIGCGLDSDEGCIWGDDGRSPFAFGSPEAA